MRKIYKKITATDSKSCLRHLIKLVDEYNNTYHRSFGKKPIVTDYSALNKETESNLKAPNLKLMIESGSLCIRICLAKVTSIIGQKKYLRLILCWKLILQHIKLNI